MHPLETYLTELREVRASGAGVKETSYYAPLANLLNEVGKRLKPKVRTILQLQNQGAGFPDGGFFTPDQLQNAHKEGPLLGQVPARGVIEVKSTTDELENVAETKQVREYIKHYGQVLITNYRDFLLLKRNSGGKPVHLEPFRLATSEAEFWTAAAHPHKTATLLADPCLEYLKRVLLHAAPLNNPKDVAFFLASYAREARARVEGAGDVPALAGIRKALEEALGMKFQHEKGEHFFRSTLVQTVFYGIFAAWVLWHKSDPSRTDAFNWKAAAWTLRVPMIKALFEQIATPTKLGPLGLVPVLDWTAAALNRVDRSTFFDKFVENRAVQYFYEPFLEAFDPALRKELGVWYTPPEIVDYQVARIDAVLREELQIEDGLADRRVYVLDPCCGTGTYLVAVLNRIIDTFKNEKGEGALAQLEAKEAAMKRVYGFEIMPAPFVVAHLQIGLVLQNLSVPLDDSKNERAGIFLTNSLTGWDFSGDNPHLTNWPELEAERKGAGVVKQEKPILVILGNPPYNAYAGVSPDEEQGLVEPYKDGLVKKWGIRKFNLDELYVRFFRLAERRIAEKTNKGIICYISNYSYLDDVSFVVMRQRFLQEFDALWFDCLNGDSRETGKLTPDGKPDPSVFSTEYNRAGIRLGTTVGLMVRQSRRSKRPRVFYRQFWGVNKRQELLQSLKVKKFGEDYQQVKPDDNNRFSFRFSEVGAHYMGWPSVVELCAEPPISGLQEMRKGTLMGIDRLELESRMRQYFDDHLDWDEIVRRKIGPFEDGGRFNAKRTRAKLIATESFSQSRIIRYALYPFEFRERYLLYFVFITKHGTYIDGFAGPQQPANLDMWAAKLVLESQPRWLRNFYLFDKNRRQIARLQALKDSQPPPDRRKNERKRQIYIKHGDCNSLIVDVLNSNQIKENEATFCLLDQRTFECEWSTLVALSKYKRQGHKIELFYFLPYAWLNRALNNQKDMHVIEKWWDRNDWPEVKCMGPTERVLLFIDRFQRELGYWSVQPWPIYESKKRKRVMYYMIHATDHPAAPYAMQRAYTHAVGPEESRVEIQMDLENYLKTLV